MSNYIVNGIVKSLPPNPKSTVGLTQLKKIFKQVFDELNVAYTDECCLEEANIFTVRNNGGILETLGEDGTWDEFVLGADSGFYAGFYPNAYQTNIAAGTGGAIDLTSYLTTINTDAGGDAFTLGDSTQAGQLKKVLLVVDGGGDAVITPANFQSATTINFSDAGDYAIFLWDGGEWVVIENNGGTIF